MWMKVKLNLKNEYHYITNKSDTDDESRLSVLSTLYVVSLNPHNNTGQ